MKALLVLSLLLVGSLAHAHCKECDQKNGTKQAESEDCDCCKHKHGKHDKKGHHEEANAVKEQEKNKE